MHMTPEEAKKIIQDREELIAKQKERYGLGKLVLSDSPERCGERVWAVRAEAPDYYYLSNRPAVEMGCWGCLVYAPKDKDGLAHAWPQNQNDETMLDMLYIEKAFRTIATDAHGN